RVVVRLSRVSPGRAREGAAADGRLPGGGRQADLEAQYHRGAADDRHRDQDRQSGVLGPRARGDEGLAGLDRHRHRRGDRSRLPTSRPRRRHLHGTGLGGDGGWPDQAGQGRTLRAGLDPRPDSHRPRAQGPGHRARVRVAPDRRAAAGRRGSGAARPLNRLKLAIGVAISAALLVYLFRSVDLAELGRQLRGAHWGWMLVAIVMAPLQLWVRGRRWWYLFPPGSNPQGITAAMMIGYMANNVLPLRAGEVVRVYVVARRWSASLRTAARPHPCWATLATLVVERVLDSLAVVLILAVLVLVVPVPRFLEV